MKFHLSFVFVLICISSPAQFAKIEDKDGYVNIRKQADIKSEVIWKFTEEDIFWCLWPEGEWFQVDFKGGSGYIHKSRVKFISDFPSIPKIKTQSDYVVFQKDSIKVEIRIKPFQESENKIEFKTRGDQKDVIKINGGETWGNFGMMPHTEYQDVNYSFGMGVQRLPREAVFNLYNPNVNGATVYFDRNNSTMYVIASNGDGAGAYVLIWIIKDRKYQKRELRVPF